MTNILKKIFFVAETSLEGKLYLFDYPLSKSCFDYLQNLYRKKINKNFQNSTSPEGFAPEQEILFQIFIFKRDENRNNFIFEIMIEDEHYISFPIWIEQNKYYKFRKNKDEGCNERRADIMKLEMFNIVFVFNKEETMKNAKELIKSIYMNLESFSKSLLFEEYNKNYLLTGIYNIIKFYRDFFKNDKLEKNDNVNKEKIENIFNKFVADFSKNHYIYRYIEKIYKNIKNNEITRLNINNMELIYYMHINLNSSQKYKIKPYHCLLKINEKQLISLSKLPDINPQLRLFISKINPYKTIQEITLENNIELNFALFFANQLISWNLAKKIFPFHNNSTFQINDNIPLEISSHNTEMSLKIVIEMLNHFTLSESSTNLDEIYRKYYKTIDNEKFTKNIVDLVKKQYLIQTSFVIFSKLPFKNEYDFKKGIINDFLNCISSKKIFEKDSEDNICMKKNNEINEDKYYYEDFLKDIKNKSNKDFILLSNIKGMIFKRLYVDEISYYSRIHIKDILETIRKYEPVFDLAVVPL